MLKYVELMGVDVRNPGGGLCLRQMEKHLQLKFQVTKLQDAPASVVRSQCTGLPTFRLQQEVEVQGPGCPILINFLQLSMRSSLGRRPKGTSWWSPLLMVPRMQPWRIPVRPLPGRRSGTFKGAGRRRPPDWRRRLARSSWRRKRQQHSGHGMKPRRAMTRQTRLRLKLFRWVLSPRNRWWKCGVWRTNFKRFFMFLRVYSLCVHCMALRSGSFRHVETSVDMRRLDCGNPWKSYLDTF